MSKYITGNIRWDGHVARLASELWLPPNLDAPTFVAAEADGQIERFCHHGWRTFVRVAGGSGFFDRMHVRDRALMTVENCVVPAMERYVYEVDEPMVVLYATLSCEITFRIEGRAPITLNRPELTLVSLPRGLPLQVEIRGGVHRQRVIGLFRNAALVDAYDLRSDSVPQVLRDIAQGADTFGRLMSVPLDHHVAGLVADLIDTPLRGEMRALQYEGRLMELAGFAIQALQRAPVDKASSQLRSDREAQIALRARKMLSLQFRSPDLEGLASTLGVNSNKLRTIFKTAFGCTMTDYCLERRIREAQLLLLQPRLSIAQVGERVGYDSASSFTSAFTAQVKMTPREYRQHRAPVSVPLGQVDG